MENPWTIEKWHVRSAFRRSGFWVPDHAIAMNGKTISGPNLELEKKIFLVTVTVRKKILITLEQIRKFHFLDKWSGIYSCEMHDSPLVSYS